MQRGVPQSAQRLRLDTDAATSNSLNRQLLYGMRASGVCKVHLHALTHSFQLLMLQRIVGAPIQQQQSIAYATHSQPSVNTKHGRWGQYERVSVPSASLVAAGDPLLM